jgi:hypothetical protein
MPAPAPTAALDGLTRSGAQAAARRELAKLPYQQAKPSLQTRFLRWLLRELGRLWSSTAAHTGGSVGLAVLLALLALLAATVSWRVGPARRRARGRATFEAATASSAGDHRAAAERFATKGAWADAVRERLRAISRELEERVLVDRRPGRTAYELATEAAIALPTAGPMVREAADIFAGIWYGTVQATEADYRRLTEIDTSVRAARAPRSAESPDPARPAAGAPA